MGLVSNTGGGLNRPTSNRGLGGFGGFEGFGSKSRRLDDTETLLELARMQGGSIQAAAEELVHPQTGILSTIGEGFKNSFKNFVEIISVPSQTIAGIIDPDITIGEAIRENISPSDVLFGDKDPEATTLQKTGSFFTRLATDVLLDPLTYLTFGASAGIFGVRAATRVTLGQEAAKVAGVAPLTAKALNLRGQELFKYLKKVERQGNGQMGADIAKLGDDVADFAVDELDDLLKESLNAPLRVDLSKRALTNLFEKKPQLVEEFLDKGGIKFFGTSIMSGQRISATRKLIPGMSFLDHLTKPARQKVNALFDTSVIKDPATGDYIRLPEEYLDLERNAADLTMALQDDRLTNLSDIVRANKLDVNESKLLFSAIEAGKIPSDPRLANVFKQLQGFNEKEFNFLKDSGIAISRLENHVPHILVRNSTKSMPFKLPPSAAVGATMERKLKGTIQEIKDAGFEGFDENIITAHARRSIDNAKAGTTRQFVREISENFGVAADEAPKGWVKINSGAIKKAEAAKEAIIGVDELGVPITTADPDSFLKGILTKNGQEFVYHPAIAKRIETFVGNVINDEATTEILKSYDSLQNMWKASVTSIWLAFHGRNGISNVFLHMLDIGVHSLNPALHGVAGDMILKSRKLNALRTRAAGVGDDAVKAMDELSELTEKTMFTDATGYKWSFGEIHEVVKRKNVAFTRQITSNLDITDTTEDLVTGLFPSKTLTTIVKKEGNIFSKKFLPFRVGRGFGTAVEEQARLVDFVANLKATGDVNLAAQRTKQFLFDYGNLTNFEKHFMKRLMPFYTFTRKNLELQVKSLGTVPGRIAAQTKFLTTLGDVMAGESLTDEERDALPDWIKSGIEILKSKKGSTVEILGSLGTPIEQPFQQFQPNTLLGSLSPLLKVPLEQASGYSFFHGKALSDVTNAASFKNAPKIIKDFIGYTEIKGNRSDGTPFSWHTSLRPERMHILLNLPPTTRVFTALKQIQAQDVSTQSKTLQQLVGLRPFSFDLEQEALKRERELREKLEKLLINAGVVAQFKRTFIPKD